MEAHIRIGSRRSFTLKQAVLIYRDDSAAFATLHEVRGEKNQAPYLGPGQPLTTAFLRTLARGLGSRITPEILAANVLVRTADSIVWWSAAQRQVMFFGGGTEEAARLNGRMYPHPPLVFKVCRHELFVRALEHDVRPDANTPLKTAPYWNTEGSRGLVCAGTMRIPQEVTADSISQWETAFFSSSFTHPSGAVRLTTHPQGFAGLWLSLEDRENRFPTEFLTDAKQSLRQFVDSSEEQ
ncbi:MAG TPA: PRTRC system protein B [Terriglobia bacterium]|jgi:PRTRC genetic system protein B|nr:PRTRC system protein B [Terriglobia bacterium]